jgi:hypothetical protein
MLCPRCQALLSSWCPTGAVSECQGNSGRVEASSRDLGAYWTIDVLLIDAVRNEAAMEWTHFKTRTGLVLRGAELYSLNEEGLIMEIRAYYASPTSNPAVNHELGDFDYAARGYPIEPPSRSDHGQ